jgi:methylmalonyl-CoA/ethylmalonyl-CoA epimerase
MDQYGLVFDHLGLAVKRPEKAIRFLEGLGYAIGEPIHDPLQHVNLIWCSSPAMPAIELVYLTDARTDSPIANILNDRNEMIYHQCYRSADTPGSIKSMKDHAIRVICVSKGKPAILFGDKIVSFYMVDGFGLIEIIEENSN